MAHEDPTTAPSAPQDSDSPAALSARPSSDPFAALDTAFDMSPVKSARVRRLHGAYTRSVRALLASAAELELDDDCQGEAQGLRRFATDLAITGMWAVRGAGRLR